jgi:dipeptidyl aminopeptidase/acylaminoacyl peptidase
VSRTGLKRRLRDELRAARPPRAEDAERRAWTLVRAAHAERGTVRRPTTARRLAVAALAAVVAAVLVLSPAGAKVGDWIDDVVSPAPDATPSTLGSLPAEGRLLVVSPGGPWVVHDDGRRRRLGHFRDATWSPGGLFVAAARGRELVALEPDGDERWALPTPGPVSTPRWSPDGYRIAYRSGRDLWIAIGDNTGRKRLARGVGPAAPAWKPGARSPGQVVAFPSRRRIRIVEENTPRLLGTTPPGPAPRELWWIADGSRLVAVSTGEIRVHDARGRLLRRMQLERGLRVTGSALDPAGRRLAVAAEETARGASEVLIYRIAPVPASGKDGARGRSPRGSAGGHADRDAGGPSDRARALRPRGRNSTPDRLYAGPGAIEGLTWSIDGRLLVVGLPDADQWLLVGPGAKAPLKEVVSGIRRKFAGGSRAATRVTAPFPRPAGWCYAEPPDPAAPDIPPCSTGAAPATWPGRPAR